jgi:DNA-binding MarR family transcriptional regulator
VCGLIDGLQAKSLVERRPHQHDGRRVLVTLSAGGADLLDTHRDRYERGLNALVADLGRAERDELSRLLDRIAS